MDDYILKRREITIQTNKEKDLFEVDPGHLNLPPELISKNLESFVTHEILSTLGRMVRFHQKFAHDN